MLTEEDVRLAVTYEEAASAAERLKQLAIQRGVEAGLALVVEIAGSLEDGPGVLSGSSLGRGQDRPALHLEMPPIGSIFSTARDWLLDTVDRVQGPSALDTAPGRRQAQVDEIPWPTRPRRGAWRYQLPSAHIPLSRAGSHVLRPGGGTPLPAAANACIQPASSAAFEDTSAWNFRGRFHSSDRDMAAAARPQASARPYSPRPAAAHGHLTSTRPRGASIPMPNLLAGVRLGPGLARARTLLADAISPLMRRLEHRQVGGKRYLAPVAGAVLMVLVVVGATRTVRAQQARQLQQRFDSLVTAAGQLEAQARTDSDRSDAQSLIRRSQALADQAATLKPGQARVAALRKDLQTDLDRLDNVLSLADPVVLTSFSGLAKDVNTNSLAADPAAFYALDGGGQRILQFLRQPKQAGAAVSKGDAVGGNQLGIPKAMAVREGGTLLVLDSNRTLWSYSVAKHAVEQVGLKSSDSWKEATAIATFGPNLYVLDAGLGNIFRYTSRDGIFTEAPSRFLEKDNHDLLGQAVSLAVDGSVWALGANGQILKLANGANQPFAVSGLPQPLTKASQLYTDANEQSLYVLDTSAARVLQIGKDGRYLRQFNLGLASPASAFWPDEPGHQLYVLSSNSLYQYQLPA